MLIDMKLLAIDEFGVVEYTCGEISKSFFESLCAIAQQEKLLNLSQIALDANTYFNEQQLKDILKELERIDRSMIDQGALQKFNNCIIKVLGLCPFSYLEIRSEM